MSNKTTYITENKIWHMTFYFLQSSEKSFYLWKVQQQLAKYNQTYNMHSQNMPC